VHYVPDDYTAVRQDLEVDLPLSWTIADLVAAVSSEVKANVLVMSSSPCYGPVNWRVDECEPIYAFEVRTPNQFYAVASVQVLCSGILTSPSGPLLLTFESREAATEAVIQAQVSEKFASVWEGDDIELTPDIDATKDEIDDSKWPESADLFLIEGLTPAAANGGVVRGLTADRRLSCAVELIRLIPTKTAVTKPGFSLAKLIRHARADRTHEHEIPEAKLQLDECFMFFQGEQLLKQESNLVCPTCHGHVRGTKRTDIWKVPNILIVRLKRLSANHRLDMVVEFPDVLDMRPYVHEPGTSDLNYRLYAVVEHGGLFHPRGTTAQVFVSPDGSKSAKWISFDHASMSAADWGDAHSGSAYMLFFEKIEVCGITRRSDDIWVGGDSD
jgi:hypothetical protein